MLIPLCFQTFQQDVLFFILPLIRAIYGFDIFTVKFTVRSWRQWQSLISVCNLCRNYHFVMYTVSTQSAVSWTCHGFSIWNDFLYPLLLMSRPTPPSAQFSLSITISTSLPWNVPDFPHLLMYCLYLLKEHPIFYL